MTLWFGVLVPVHNRGEIREIGAGSASAGHARCPAAASECHRGDAAPDAAPPAGGCAVCVFIAGLDAPPPVTVAPVCLGPAGAAPATELPRAPAFHRPLPYHSRGPPAA